MTGYLLNVYNPKMNANEIMKTEENLKWRRKPEKRPDDILDGALIEFRLKGFKGARIEDIAKHAGLSKGTVYLYFKSKEEMLKALVRRSIIPTALSLKEISENVCDHNSDEPASDVLRKMLMLVAKQMIGEKAGAIPILIIGEAGRFPELAEFYRNEVIESSMKALSSVIRRGIDQNEFRELDIMISLRTLMGAVIMQVIWSGVFAANDEAPLSASDLINNHIDIFLNGVLTPKKA